MASDQVQLKGYNSGMPKAVRLPSRAMSAERIDLGSDAPVKTRLSGSWGVPLKSVPVYGHRDSVPPGTAIGTSTPGGVAAASKSAEPEPPGSGARESVS